MKQKYLLVFPLLLLSLRLVADDGYRMLKKMPIPGPGGFDYLIVDESRRRLYVSHGMEVEVLDIETGELLGKIADTPGVHGIALADASGFGFISQGQASSIRIFSPRTLQPVSVVTAGQNPDAIVYEETTNEVFAFNGGSDSATVINVADGKIRGSVALGGKPEF